MQNLDKTSYKKLIIYNKSFRLTFNKIRSIKTQFIIHKSQQFTRSKILGLDLFYACY